MENKREEAREAVYRSLCSTYQDVYEKTGLGHPDYQPDRLAFDRGFDAGAASVDRVEIVREAFKKADDVIASLYPAIRYKGVEVVWSREDREATRELIGEYDLLRDAVIAAMEKEK